MDTIKITRPLNLNILNRVEWEYVIWLADNNPLSKGELMLAVWEDETQPFKFRLQLEIKLSSL